MVSEANIMRVLPHPMVEQIARAVLYEGYILYPYRPSVKNAQRWSFGGLLPQAYVDANPGSDAAAMRAQCLLTGWKGASVRVSVRFLHLTRRSVGILEDAPANWTPTNGPPPRWVDSLTVGGRKYLPWQEAIERQVDFGLFDCEALLRRPVQESFALESSEAFETLRDAAGTVVGVLRRKQEALRGKVRVSTETVGDILKLTVHVENAGTMQNAASATRDEAMLHAMVSAHAVLTTEGGEFVSLMDPPESLRAAIADCKNIGVFPVLVGSEPDKTTLLASPIILYDYPQIAPESPGDLFDGTEIDEILTLRILTLTDDEKQAAAAIDPRAEHLLRRTESLARDQLMRMHGMVRPVPAAADIEERHA